MAKHTVHRVRHSGRELNRRERFREGVETVGAITGGAYAGVQSIREAGENVHWVHHHATHPEGAFKKYKPIVADHFGKARSAIKNFVKSPKVWRATGKAAEFAAEEPIK